MKESERERKWKKEKERRAGVTVKYNTSENNRKEWVKCNADWKYHKYENMKIENDIRATDVQIK